MIGLKIRRMMPFMYPLCLKDDFYVLLIIMFTGAFIVLLILIWIGYFKK